MFKRRFFRKWIGPILLLVLFLTNSLQGACDTQGAARTFIQLWRRDAGRTPSQWDQWFRDLKALGFTQIIVQWSSFGSVGFYADAGSGRETSVLLETFIEAAGRHAIQIWLGLHYDPEFWQALDKDPRGPEKYLQNRLDDIERNLPFLTRAVEVSDPRGKIVKGWYISDEIDDQNWRDETRRKVLFNYLTALRSRLRHERSSWPVMISGFCNGIMPPSQWTAFWNDLLLQTGIDELLFQDGVGAGKLTLQKLKAYLQSFSSSFVHARRTFGVIVEVFQLNTDAGAQPRQLAADFARVRQQLSLARTYSRAPVTVFSAPDYLMNDRVPGGSQLRRSWRQALATCKKSH